MGFPAARLTDLHICPMITGVVPHVGGPILGPGCPRVLISGLPAARMTDVATCVGPPDTIVEGSSGVLIGGLPAARVLDQCVHGGMIVMGAFTVLIGESLSGAPAVSCGLGPEVDKLAALSPTLEANISILKADGWTVAYGPAGKGSYTDRKAKQIVIDSNEKGDPKAVAQTLAHESGHARYTPDPYVPPTGLTRSQYVQRNVDRNLKDEGEATLTNAQVRNEILKKGGPDKDIGIAGQQAAKYEAVPNKYPDPEQRGTAREEIGNIFATGEHPSTDPSKTYSQYYSKPFEDYWDKNVAKNP